jgi:hypothetical protein
MDTPAQSHSQNSISNILTSLREVLIEENALLESGQAHDHQRFVRSKNQILRDLIVCQRNLPPLIEIPAVREQFQGVRKLVDRNHFLLRTHVEAMTEITSLLTEAEISEDADGTYSQRSVG